MSNEKYYYLKEGEIIMAGDEVQSTNTFNYPHLWTATMCVGEKAPNRLKYRRLISVKDQLLAQLIYTIEEYLEPDHFVRHSNSFIQLKKLLNQLK